MNNIIKVNNQSGKIFDFNFEIEHYDDLYVYLDNQNLKPYISNYSIRNEDGGSIELVDYIKGYTVKDLRLYRILDAERQMIYVNGYPILAKDINIEYNNTYERLNELAYSYYETIKYNESYLKETIDKIKIRLGQVVLLNINNTNNKYSLANGGTIPMTGNEQLLNLLENDGNNYIKPDFSDYNSNDGLTKAYIKIEE